MADTEGTKTYSQMVPKGVHTIERGTDPPTGGTPSGVRTLRPRLWLRCPRKAAGPSTLCCEILGRTDLFLLLFTVLGTWWVCLIWRFVTFSSGKCLNGDLITVPSQFPFFSLWRTPSNADVGSPELIHYL